MTTALIISQVLLWIVLGLTLLGGLALARQVGVLYERVAPVGALTATRGPEPGSVAPRLKLAALDGQTIEIGGPSASGRSSLVLFVSAQCPVCKVLIPTAREVARSEGLDLILAGDAPEAEQRALIMKHGLGDLPFVNSSEFGRTYAVDKLPHAILIDGKGIIAGRGLVNSREHLESLVEARDSGLRSVQEYLSAARA
ncbi:thioredoxin domain-containing protein [Novosphingobium beihaiensis]|uniref:Methylamine utilization protein MauD n=1 Tax=Novosphingobium beihaiensis TaxID=2930389 RepID=A0ABT0BL91_9SPHN|nr:methylamine utilization protein MauD [Novosphingobium beihaiensis]MCJ2185831.1 methylamine utilization protein MauD [Novosphingobium beihaiensis]